MAAELNWKVLGSRLCSKPIVQANTELFPSVQRFKRNGSLEAKERHLVHVERYIAVRVEHNVEMTSQNFLSMVVLRKVSQGLWWFNERALIIAEAYLPVNCHHEHGNLSMRWAVTYVSWQNKPQAARENKRNNFSFEYLDRVVATVASPMRSRLYISAAAKRNMTPARSRGSLEQYIQEHECQSLSSGYGGSATLTVEQFP